MGTAELKNNFLNYIKKKSFHARLQWFSAFPKKG